MPGDGIFRLETIELDLPELAGTFGRRLREAGLPISVERELRFAQALGVVRPVARRRLYWTARAVFVSDQTQAKAFDAVFRAVFGSGHAPAAEPPEELERVPASDPEAEPMSERAIEHADGGLESFGSSTVAGDQDESESRDAPVPVAASDEERLREKRFDALEPAELAELYRLMVRLDLATPLRRTRRSERYRHGRSVDMRRTLRRSMRTAGDPIRISRRRRRIVRRPIVLLCDISGSMEPYARAYLQFLTCATGGGRRAEAFVFATRLTRLTRALSSRNPERALQQAAAAAPDWSSGTRIGDALKTFNDRHGRRGMARGAVVVILSDGWERGDPGLVGQEMERLRRLAYRVVWVNPRAAAPGFSPRAGGMAAALPHCDALVSGHSLEALGEVIDAIGADRWLDAVPGVSWRPPEQPDPAEDEDEPWASATPVQGSSVAMPSGYGPSRGRTTPGWGSAN
jgi:uncharacterized protein with von Willebrand factor type A (vWA) domain